MGGIKIKDSFVLRKICGYNIVMPVGKSIKDFQGSLLLNQTGTIIFEQLREGKSICEIAKILAEEYDVTIPIVLKDIISHIEALKGAGVIDETITSGKEYSWYENL